EIVTETETQPTNGETAVTGEATPAPAPTADVNATVDVLIQSANDHFTAAEAAQRDGDWATYGKEIDALQRDLEQLSVLSGQN
ncbi:MAG: hypothetical protein P8183_06525, partial [Anaerolineae bacterium]